MSVPLRGNQANAGKTGQRWSHWCTHVSLAHKHKHDNQICQLPLTERKRSGSHATQRRNTCVTVFTLKKTQLAPTTLHPTVFTPTEWHLISVHVWGFVQNEKSDKIWHVTHFTVLTDTEQKQLSHRSQSLEVFWAWWLLPITLQRAQYESSIMYTLPKSQYIMKKWLTDHTPTLRPPGFQQCQHNQKPH